MSIKAVLCVIAVSARQPIAKQWYHLSLQFRKVHSVTCMCNQEPIVWSLRYLQPQGRSIISRSNKVVRQTKANKKAFVFMGPTGHVISVCTCDSVAQQERLRWLRENCSWYSSCCSRSWSAAGHASKLQESFKKTFHLTVAQSFTANNHSPQKPCSSSTIRHGIDKFGM